MIFQGGLDPCPPSGFAHEQASEYDQDLPQSQTTDICTLANTIIISFILGKMIENIRKDQKQQTVTHRLR